MQKSEAAQKRRIGGDRLGLGESLTVAAAENVGGDHQLVAAHDGVAAYFVRIDVD